MTRDRWASQSKCHCDACEKARNPLALTTPEILALKPGSIARDDVETPAESNTFAAKPKKQVVKRVKKDTSGQGGLF